MPLHKSLSLVVAFDTTTAAMTAEEYLLKHDLPGRIIPLPSEISAGCGLSWKAAPKDKDAILAALDEAGIPYGGTYELVI